MTGNYEIVPGKPPAFGLQPSPALPLLAVLAALYFALSNLAALVRVGEGDESRRCLSPALAGVWMRSSL